ncbi:protein of unknown function [Candidatus Promineifilum breve]|uniref:Uncharacterized protein n=1 Tax=Candidatus Promineifilum breve TaxID=1806508 RepID=A0A170PDK9_9CHLR|nr:hypothetical protein [Candidatus Promineifilum breve]CUS02077.2 protein of unknown function [Candidatus Promineifilum breve]
MSNHTNTNLEAEAEKGLDKAQEVATRAQQKVSETATAAQHKVSETAAVAKEQVTRKAAQVGEQAKASVDTRMNEVAHELGSVADAVRQTTHEVGGDENATVSRYGEQLAGQIEGISSYLNNNGVEEVLDDLQNFARRQPAMFLGGAFMLGIVVGRFLRSSADRGYGLDQGGRNQYGQPYTDASYGGSTGYSGGATGYSDQSRNRAQPGLNQASTTAQNWD